MLLKQDKNLKVIRDMNPNSLILFKMGTFYHGYGKDAYLLSYLFGYQLKTLDGMISTCGFPISAVEKIVKELNNKKINYILIAKNNNYAIEDEVIFEKENKYNDFSEKAYKYIVKKNKIDGISAYLIDSINDDNFQDKIMKIEKILYGN